MASAPPGRMRHHLHRKDLLWLLAYPLYQLIGTFRHEASHALAAVLQGATVQEFVFWPTSTGSGFRWGYVSWSGPTNWVVTAAPYLCDLATFALFFVICARWPLRRHWVWVNLVVIGLVSPLVNSAYNYLNGVRGCGDVGRLLVTLPWQVVHTYFVATLALYVAVLFLTLSPRTSAVAGQTGG
jgi:hypothetical protein